MLRLLFFFALWTLLVPAAQSADDTANESNTNHSAPEAEEVKQPTDEKAKPARIISKSGQFTVTAPDSLLAGAVATKSDEIRSELIRLLSLSKSFTHKINIILTGRADSPSVPQPIRTRINVIPGELSYEIRIHLGGGINLEKLHTVIISMLLYERSLRNVNPEAFPDEVTLPPWLLAGIDQAVLWNTGKIDRNIYSSLFNRAELLNAEQILGYKTPETLDASSRLVYNTSCGVLVMSLINQKGGKDALLSLLDQAVLGEGDLREIIERNFQSFRLNNEALQKWWALQLAQLSTPKVTESLSPSETEKRLVDALLFIHYDESSRTPLPISLDDVELAVSLPDWQAQSRRVLDQLVHLSIRCFPGYRPIITEYCRMIAALQNGMPAENAIQMVAPLIELREAYITASLRARDYLDWFEITHLGNKSGNFDAYLDTMKILRSEPEHTRTAVSDYLDDIQALYRLPAQAPLPTSLKRRAASESLP